MQHQHTFKWWSWPQGRRLLATRSQGISISISVLQLPSREHYSSQSTVSFQQPCSQDTSFEWSSAYSGRQKFCHLLKVIIKWWELWNAHCLRWQSRTAGSTSRLEVNASKCYWTSGNRGNLVIWSQLGRPGLMGLKINCKHVSGNNCMGCLVVQVWTWSQTSF